VEVVSRIDSIKQRTIDLKCQNKQIGFLPTMGALHEGHLSLLRRCIRENDVTVCSIFVNPIQFNNPDDLKKYPRDLDRDLALLKKEGCDFVFTPKAEEFYIQQPVIKLNFGDLETEMEGSFRPGHFNGVAIVVSRLLHLVNANRAYFGLKDLQQYYIVRRMCIDLGIPVEIIANEIVRESDGLAMSSRNQRLSPEDRKLAPVLYAFLKAVREELLIEGTLRNAVAQAKKRIQIPGQIEMEYLNLVSLPAFIKTESANTHGQYAICLAAHIGGVRLIDNLIFDL
jgi:pantoate--beta-alanine ligase